MASLVLESERLGFQFMRRLADDWTANINWFARPGEALFAAKVGQRIVGVCGLNIDPYLSDSRIGRVRHLYVLVEYRRRGIGRQLVEQVIAAATGVFHRLRLRTDDPDASCFYETMGFFRCAAPSDCTHTVDLPSDV